MQAGLIDGRSHILGSFWLKYDLKKKEKKVKLPINRLQLIMQLGPVT